MEDRISRVFIQRDNRDCRRLCRRLDKKGYAKGCPAVYTCRDCNNVYLDGVYIPDFCKTCTCIHTHGYHPFLLYVTCEDARRTSGGTACYYSRGRACLAFVALRHPRRLLPRLGEGE